MNDQRCAGILRKIKDVNFIAAAISPWHCIGIKANILYFERKKNIRFRGIILVAPHPNTGKCLSRNDFEDLEGVKNGDIQIIEEGLDIKSIRRKVIDNVRSIKNARFSKSPVAAKNVYVFNTMYPDLNWTNIVNAYDKDALVTYVLTDEGAGSYYPDTVSFWINMKVRGEGNKLKKAAKVAYLFPLACFRWLIKSQIQKKLKNNGRYIEGTLFQRSESSTENFCLNKRVAPYYKEALALRKIEISRDDADKFSRPVLINTTCDSDGTIHGEDLRSLEILAAVLNRHNIDAAIKPHPREKDLSRYKSLGFDIVSSGAYSQEEIFANLDAYPKIVFGFCSTTLLTLPAIFGVKAISMTEIMDHKKLDREISEAFRDYRDLHSDMVEFPESEEELEALVCDYVEAGK